MIRDMNVDPDYSSFAKHRYFITLRDAATTMASVSIGGFVMPYRGKVTAVKVLTMAESSGSMAVNVLEAGTSILSGNITPATTASTIASGTVSDSDIAADAVVLVQATKGNNDGAYLTVIVEFRPYLGAYERVPNSLT